MSILGTLFGSGEVSSTVDAVGNTLDKLFTSDDERLQAQAILEKLRQHPGELQVELNKIEAANPSIFVSGWRPFIGWICGCGIGYVWLIRPLIMDIATVYGITVHFSDLPIDHMIDLVIALLGLGGLRTFEKMKRVARH